MTRCRKPKNMSKKQQGITAITVQGYKSLYDECRLEIRPLTILAGANSSGKSSAMQPLLLLKQTIEASYDPGPLLLDGPNVRFTSASQLLSRLPSRSRPASFRITLGLTGDRSLRLSYTSQLKRGFVIGEMTYSDGKEAVTLRPGMGHDDIMSLLPDELRYLYDNIAKSEKRKPKWSVGRTRCFLELWLEAAAAQKGGPGLTKLAGFSPCGGFEAQIREVIHVPGLRGNPERTYKTTAVGSVFPGTFETYVASVVSHWQLAKGPLIGKLREHLETLGLTWKVEARPIDETQVELRVGRLLHGVRGGARDLVSIADVGFGVSQALPVVVSLLAATPGELVYLEQPELHLHPRAQTALVELLADAARRGAKVVAETHSPLLLLGVQSLVAEGFPAELVKLYWFQRGKDGRTKVTGADLDSAGGFGDWPQDFGDVELKAESRYLDAAERVRGGK